jgi:pseudouridine-5'-phosphate glycosidase
MPADEIDAVIEEALAAMDKAGIGGKAATPYLLERIAARTAGRSLAANIALVLNNATVAAKIAREFSKLEAMGSHRDG